MKKFSLFPFLVLCAVTYAASAQETIKIGVLTDLSGNASYYGNQMRVGASLAEKELREQGKDVKVVFEDSGLSTSRGLSAAQKLLFIDKVDALYVDFSIIAIAVSSLMERQKKVMMYGAAAESIVHKNRFSFKTYSDYSLGCEAMAREFIKVGVKRIGVLKADSEYGELCLEGAKKAISVTEATYRQGEGVATQMLSFKGDQIEAVLNGGFEGDALNMLKAAGDLKYQVRFGMAEDMVSEEIQKKFGAALEGALTFGLQKVSDRVIEKAKGIRGGAALSSFENVGLGYVHIKQLAAAVEACPDRSGECISDAISRQGQDNDIGFEGWKNRIARLRTVIKRFSEGSLQKINSYVANQ